MQQKHTFGDTYITVRPQHDLARIQKIPVTRGDLSVSGKYSLFLEVTAQTDTVYIPVSVASGRKSAGFIYYIEGSAPVSARAHVVALGDAITIVALGTISYCKIPKGKTALFKLFAEVDVARKESYRFVVTRINYKLNPNDARYKRFVTEIATDFLKYRR